MVSIRGSKTEAVIRMNLFAKLLVESLGLKYLDSLLKSHLASIGDALGLLNRNSTLVTTR